MPHFDIVKQSNIRKTFRVARIMGDFDVKPEHCNERFVGDIDLPTDWNVGLIVGNSGTGKTTIAENLFSKNLYKGGCFEKESVIDDMPQSASVDEIEQAFYAVGFGSVPSWLKPYSVLSNGEKMRVDLANALLQNELVVFDEFTSVVDRNVARVCCVAVEKAVRRNGKQFVAVTCHRDIIEWLQPDWIFDTDEMQMSFPSAHDRDSGTPSGDVGEKNGESLDAIII